MHTSLAASQDLVYSIATTELGRITKNWCDQSELVTVIDQQFYNKLVSIQLQKAIRLKSILSDYLHLIIVATCIIIYQNLIQSRCTTLDGSTPVKSMVKDTPMSLSKRIKNQSRIYLIIITEQTAYSWCALLSLKWKTPHCQVMRWLCCHLDSPAAFHHVDQGFSPFGVMFQPSSI